MPSRRSRLQRLCRRGIGTSHSMSSRARAAQSPVRMPSRARGHRCKVRWPPSGGVSRRRPPGERACQMGQFEGAFQPEHVRVPRPGDLRRTPGRSRRPLKKTTTTGGLTALLVFRPRPGWPPRVRHPPRPRPRLLPNTRLFAWVRPNPEPSYRLGTRNPSRSVRRSSVRAQGSTALRPGSGALSIERSLTAGRSRRSAPPSLTQTAR